MSDTSATTNPAEMQAVLTAHRMQRWEYQTSFHKIGLFNDRKKRDGWDDELASMGQNGWELVQVMLVQGQGTRDGYHFIFKRPTIK